MKTQINNVIASCLCVSVLGLTAAYSYNALKQVAVQYPLNGQSESTAIEGPNNKDLLDSLRRARVSVYGSEVDIANVQVQSLQSVETGIADSSMTIRPALLPPL